MVDLQKLIYPAPESYSFGLTNLGIYLGVDCHIMARPKGVVKLDEVHVRVNNYFKTT